MAYSYNFINFDWTNLKNHLVTTFKLHQKLLFFH